MPIYRWPRGDAAALAEQFALARKVAQDRARRPVGEVPDPTPPPVNVEPADLTRFTDALDRRTP